MLYFPKKDLVQAAIFLIFTFFFRLIKTAFRKIKHVFRRANLKGCNLFSKEIVYCLSLNLKRLCTLNY